MVYLLSSFKFHYVSNLPQTLLNFRGKGPFKSGRDGNAGEDVVLKIIFLCKLEFRQGLDLSTFSYGATL